MYSGENKGKLVRKVMYGVRVGDSDLKHRRLECRWVLGSLGATCRQPPPNIRSDKIKGCPASLGTRLHVGTGT